MATQAASEELRARIAMLERALEQERTRANEERTRANEEKARADAATAERDRLRAAYRQLQQDMELLRRRIFVAKAERVDTRQLELEFAQKHAALSALGEQLGPALAAEPSEQGAAALAPPPADDKTKPRPTGRRDLRTLPI